MDAHGNGLSEYKWKGTCHHLNPSICRVQQKTLITLYNAAAPNVVPQPPQLPMHEYTQASRFSGSSNNLLHVHHVREGRSSSTVRRMPLSAACGATAAGACAAGPGWPWLLAV